MMLLVDKKENTWGQLCEIRDKNVFSVLCCSQWRRQGFSEKDATASFQYLKRSLKKEGKGCFMLGDSDKKRVAVLN